MSPDTNWGNTVFNSEEIAFIQKYIIKSLFLTIDVMWLYHLYWTLHDVEKLFAAPPKFDVVHVVHVTDRTGFKDGGVGRTCSEVKWF